jgi:hypothetical protein
MFWSKIMISLKNVLFGISIFINVFFISMTILGSITGAKVSRISIPSMENGYITAAAVVGFPSSASATFNLIEIKMARSDTAFIQFSFYSDGSQGNMLINALYDPRIISVTQTGYGLEITALASGNTLMQTVTNEGIKDIAFVTVN